MTRSSSPGPYRLLVFDWDGTVVDSIGAILGCTRQACLDLELPVPGEDAIRGCIGLGLGETLLRLLPADEGAHEAFIARYRTLWIDRYHAEPGPFPGVEELLSGLKAAGYWLAVATGKSRRGLDRDFERTGLGDHFLVSRCADESRSKPDPRMLHEILDELGVTAREALMIGDTVHDLGMAANAGVDAVAVLGGSQGRQELAPLRPLAMLPTVIELPVWLDRRQEGVAAG